MPAVRHPAGALAGPQTFPNSAQSAFGHAESFLRCHCRFVPAIHVLVTEAHQDVDARDNPRIKSWGAWRWRMIRRHRNVPYFLQPLGQPEVGEVTSLLTATNLPKG